MALRDIIKESFLARYLVRKLRARRYRAQSREETFSAIYRSNAWGSADSRSGPGSSHEETRVVRELLPVLLGRLGARSMLDAPCGDFHWMEQVNLGDVRYFGADIVPEMIAENQRRNGRAGREFVQRDLAVDPLPAVDFVLCRECLQHLGFAEILAVLRNLCGTGAGHLLMTTFPKTTRNADIGHGGWWPMNLELAPFHLGPPLELHSENSPDVEAQRVGKSLGLWPREAVLKAVGK